MNGGAGKSNKTVAGNSSSSLADKFRDREYLASQQQQVVKVSAIEQQS